MTEIEKQIPERRDAVRSKSLVKRTILATVEDEAYGSMANHLYIEDLATKGMRINLDREVEPESRLLVSFPLESLGFALSGEFRATCRVVWSRPLHGGTCMLGLEFQELDEQASENLRLLLEHWEEKQGIELQTLRTPVDAKVRFEEGEAWSKMVSIRAISKDGFKFTSTQSVEPDKNIEIRILLESGNLETAAKVRWCKAMANGVYEIGCQFLQLSASHLGFLELHLRRCP